MDWVKGWAALKEEFCAAGCIKGFKQFPPQKKDNLLIFEIENRRKLSKDIKEVTIQPWFVPFFKAASVYYFRNKFTSRVGRSILFLIPQIKGSREGRAAQPTARAKSCSSQGWKMQICSFLSRNKLHIFLLLAKFCINRTKICCGQMTFPQTEQERHGQVSALSW